MKTQHEILMEDPEFRRLLSIEALVAEASELIAKLMADQNVTKAELARRLGKSRSWVTQMLSGRANVTVRTLAEVAYALDAEVKMRSQPPRWKSSAKPLGSGWQPVSFKMDSYTVDPPAVSQDVFCLRSKSLDSDEDPVAGEDASEFAA
jgi:transcriptional regulator with XRE-family HTH domain